MAILGPDQLPILFKNQSDPLKMEILTNFGHPVVHVELSETMLEASIRVTGDFIAQYFPYIQKMFYFYTSPLVSEYDLPKDAYWIRDIAWDPSTVLFNNVFSQETYLLNAGAIAGGLQGFLLDYHLLQAYRKFSNRILATEGQWEVTGNNKIRLFPTPRGSYPVAVIYIPSIYQWRSASHREVMKRMMIAEATIMLGNIRAKFGSIPSPDGGSIQMNGESLAGVGQDMKEKALADALLLGEPLSIYTF